MLYSSNTLNRITTLDGSQIFLALVHFELSHSTDKNDLFRPLSQSRAIKAQSSKREPLINFLETRTRHDDTMFESKIALSIIKKTRNERAETGVSLPNRISPWWNHSSPFPREPCTPQEYIHSRASGMVDMRGFNTDGFNFVCRQRGVQIDRKTLTEWNDFSESRL